MLTSPKHTKTITERVIPSKNCTDLETIKLPPVNPLSFEIFRIPNLEIILTETQGQTSGTSSKKKNTDSYINYIEGINNNSTMLVFTDGSTLKSPGPTGAGAVIRKE